VLADAVLDFSTGLTGWTIFGNATVESTTVNSNPGGIQFSLTPPTGENMVQITPSGSTVGISNIDATLGLTAGTMLSVVSTGDHIINGVSTSLTTTNYGGITKNITLNQGTYTFSWAYSAGDYIPFTDGVFFSLAGNGISNVNLLARNGDIAITQGSIGYSAETAILQSYGSTAWLQNTFTISTTGNYQISFGDFNALDESLDPVLFVGRVNGTYSGTPVSITPPSASTDISSVGTVYQSSNLGTSVNPVFDGGTLQVSVAGEVANSFTVNSNGGVIDQNGVASTLSGVISDASGATGSISIINTGSGGSVTLSGINTYTGATSITSGSTLVLSGSGLIATSTGVADNGTFDITATGASVKTLSGSGSLVTATDKNLTLTNAADTFSGVISGGGKLVIASGTETLSGTNTHTGGVEVDAGATLTISSASNLGTGVLNLVGTLSTTATLNVLASTIISNQIKVTAVPTFNITSGTTTTVSSPIVDGLSAGDVNVIGGGTLELTAINTYTGATSVTNGSTLALSGSGSITTSSALNNSGTVDIRGASGNVALGGTLTQASAGSLLMNISPTNNQKVLLTSAASLAGNLSLTASAGTYTSGKYTLITANGVTGTFGTFSSTLPTYTRLAYSLGYDANNVYLFLTPNVADTQTSLTNNLVALQGIYNLQTSTINNGLNYDCSLFDVHGLCISNGGRYTNTNTPTGDSTGALVIGGYRVNDKVRIGAYLDQGISSSTPTGINLKQHNPLFGAFAVWQARQDGLGAKVKLAAGYNDSDMTVTRAVVGASEAGSGSTSLTSQAVSVVGSYGVEMQGSWIASPYVGIRYTDVKAGGYTEASSATVTAPLTYASLSQSTTSLLAGIRWFGKLTDRVGLNGSIGVEQDVSNNNSSYTATGLAGLTSIVFNTDINKTRPVASIGTTVSIDKRQQLAFSVFYSEQAFSKSSSTSAYGTYTIGF
jgi:autotransporter-associated beta strand protein